MALKFLNDGYFAAKVGIGTESPTSPLHITRTATDYSGPAIVIKGISIAGTGDINNGFGLYLSYNLSGNRQFVFADTATSQGVRFINSGIDGFNVSTQQRADLTLGTETNGVHVAAGVSNTQFSVSNVSGTASKIVTEIKGAASQSGNYLNISSSSGTGDILTVKSSGNVGIGEDTPLSSLHVSGPAGNRFTEGLRVERSTVPAQFAMFNYNGGSLNIIATNTAGTGTSMKFQKSNDGSALTDHMVIDNSGNVGIGTTSPTAAKLVVSSNTAPQLLIKCPSGGSSIAQILLEENSGGTQNASITFDQAANNTLTIATGYVSPTDENKIALTPGTTTAMTLRGGDDSTNTAGAIQFNGYVGTRQTGTPTYLLGTDASGNIVKTNTIPGSAAGPYLPLAGGRMTTTSKIEFYNASQYIYANSTNDLTIASGDDINFQTNYARFFNAGVESARISATTNSWLANGSNAKLGINRTDPSYTLDVNGTLRVTSNIITGSALLSNQENTDVDTGTETVASVAIATYTAGFFDFVIKKTTNVRSGTVYACHDGTNVEFTETSTQDLGDTSDVTLSVDISGGSMRLRATTTSDDWSVKSLIRAI